MKAVKHKITGKIVYRQSPDFNPGMGTKNAVILNGGKEEDYYETELTQEEVQVEKDTQLQRQQELEQKKIDIETNLPSWTRVSTAIDNISTLADAKTFLKKLTRVVYWAVKDKQE